MTPRDAQRLLDRLDIIAETVSPTERAWAQFCATPGSPEDMAAHYSVMRDTPHGDCPVCETVSDLIAKR